MIRNQFDSSNLACMTWSPPRLGQKDAEYLEPTTQRNDRGNRLLCEEPGAIFLQTLRICSASEGGGGMMYSNTRIWLKKNELAIIAPSHTHRFFFKSLISSSARSRRPDNSFSVFSISFSIALLVSVARSMRSSCRTSI